MQTCDHLNQLMSQVLQTPILQTLTLQSQILSIFTLSCEDSPDVLCRCGGILDIFICKKMVYFEIGFHNTIQAGLRLMLFPLLSVL